MKSIMFLALTAFFATAAQATDGAEPVLQDVPDVLAVTPQGFPLLDAADVTLDEFLWTNRLVVVFADTPNDPLFQQQMRLLNREYPEYFERDLLVVVDTNPAAQTDARRRLRPRGFSLVLVDKDGGVKQRKPSPWTAREIFHAIDRLPLRREEMLQQRPGRMTD